MVTCRNYGRVNEDGTIEYAPITIHTKYGLSCNADKESYLEQGWFPIESTTPNTPAGHRVKSCRYEQDGNRITRVYEYEKKENSARRFSVFGFELACFKAGILEKVDEFIDSQTITNEEGGKIPLRRVYERVTEFSDDNEYFNTYFNAGLDYCGLSRGQGEGILASCLIRR